MGYIAKTEDTSFENMKRAIIYGSAMASFCVEQFSVDALKSLDAAQINERVKRFVELVNFDLVMEIWNQWGVSTVLEEQDKSKRLKAPLGA